MDPMREREPVERVREAGAKVLTGLGKTIEEGIKALGERGNVVMVRINDQSLRSIDALVEVGLFKSRSEAAAFLIHEGMKARADIFERIHRTVDEISQLRQQLQEILREEEAPRPEAAPPPTAPREYPETTI